MRNRLTPLARAARRTLALCLIVGAGALAGCAAARPATVFTPVTVRVPVAQPVYCPAPKLKRPALAISSLKPDSRPADTIRAYAATVAVLKGAVLARDAILAGCTRPEPAHPGSPGARAGHSSTAPAASGAGAKTAR